MKLPSSYFADRFNIRRDHHRRKKKETPRNDKWLGRCLHSYSETNKRAAWSPGKVWNFCADVDFIGRTAPGHQ